jgi:hypothetical protein
MGLRLHSLVKPSAKIYDSVRPDLLGSGSHFDPVARSAQNVYTWTLRKKKEPLTWRIRK